MCRKLLFCTCMLVFVLVTNIQAQALYTCRSETVENQIKLMEVRAESQQTESMLFAMGNETDILSGSNALVFTESNAKEQVFSASDAQINQK